MVGFAGPSLVEQTTRQGTPKGFQTAESLVEHGMIDAVVPRSELTVTVELLLDYLMSPGVPDAASGAVCAVPASAGEAS
jgi:acetyl-CoA carboxylase carboxyl transferase subunit beta